MPTPTKKLKSGQRAATMGDFLDFDKKARAERAATSRLDKKRKGQAANRALVLKRKAANKVKSAKIKKRRAAKVGTKILQPAGQDSGPNPFR